MTDMTLSLHDRPVPDRAAPHRPGRSQRVVTPQRRRLPGGFLAGLKRRLRVRPWSTTAYGAFLAVGAAALINAAFLQQPSPDRGFLGRSAAPAVAQPPAPPARPADLAQPAPAGQTAAPGLSSASAQGQPVVRQALPNAAPAVPPQTVTAPARQPAPSASAQRDAARETVGRDPIGDLIRTGYVPAQGGDPVTRGDVPRPPGAVPGAAADSRIAAAQRALNRVGVGPVKADGRFGEETRAAIERFERERRLPVTRELSPRTVRELAAVSGLRIE